MKSSSQITGSVFIDQLSAVFVVDVSDCLTWCKHFKNLAAGYPAVADWLACQDRPAVSDSLPESERTAAPLFSQAQIEQWIEFTTHEIDPPMCSWYYAIAGYYPYNKQVRGLSR